MPTESLPSNLHVSSFARSRTVLCGESSALHLGFDRLRSESCVREGLLPVQWQVTGENRETVDGVVQPWLHVEASAQLALTCQRCLEPVHVQVHADRWFRFVVGEELAETEDDLSEEDVLALEERLDLSMLVEDELLMSLPMVPLHDECPVHVPTHVADLLFDVAESERPHPFAALSDWNNKPKPP